MLFLFLLLLFDIIVNSHLNMANFIIPNINFKKLELLLITFYSKEKSPENLPYNIFSTFKYWSKWFWLHIFPRALIFIAIHVLPLNRYSIGYNIIHIGNIVCRIYHLVIWTLKRIRTNHLIMLF